MEGIRRKETKSCLYCAVCLHGGIMAYCRTGQNPSGTSMFLERRKDLYAVFQKHDIIIIEDDPYCKPLSILNLMLDFLQMEPYTGEQNPTYTTPNIGQELLSSLIPS